MAAATRGATAPSSRCSNGLASSTPRSRYLPIRSRSASSRLNPNTIWVRSLVPNEKKSAWIARSSARRAARGVSTMVPTGRASPMADVAISSRTQPRTSTSSDAVATRGSITEACGSDPAARASATAAHRARTCIRYRPSRRMARRTPRVPSIGLYSRSSAVSPRNSCCGASRRRTTTGWGAMASSTPTRSDRCTTSRSSRAAASSAGSSAARNRCTSGSLSPRNRCSVRHRPMPSAPKSRARAASSARSAFARTPTRLSRISSAQDSRTSSSGR